MGDVDQTGAGMTWAALAPWLACLLAVLVFAGAAMIALVPDVTRRAAAFLAAWADAMDYLAASYREYRDEALAGAKRRNW